MKNFERNYVIDNSRESDGPRERHYTIELSDREHRERLTPPVMDKESMSPALKEKFDEARKLTKDTKVIDLRKNNEKSKSKITERKPKKNNRKPNKSAVEKIQA